MSLAARVMAGYAAQAPALIAQYNAVPSDRIYAGVRDLFPTHPVRVLDVGAGSGRDAAWCTRLGHTVTAVDPVAAFVEEILQRVPAATILRDRLPELAQVRGQYGLILVNGVWHHIDPRDHAAALARLARALAPRGRLVLSLRHGPAHPERPGAPTDPDAVVTQAETLGLAVLRRVDSPAAQAGNRAADVTWTWIVLEKGAVT